MNEMKTPQQILGADWTARKDYVQAKRVWANYIAGTSLVDIFQSENVWCETQRQLALKNANAPGLQRLQCSVRELVRTYCSIGIEAQVPRIVWAYNNGELSFIYQYAKKTTRPNAEMDDSLVAEIRKRQAQKRRMERQVRKSGYRDPTVSERERNEE